MPKYRLLIDLATDRVIYFTTDLIETIHTDKNCVQAVFEGELPKDMTQMNSRNFTYIDKILENTVIKSVVNLPLHSLNKQSLFEFLNQHLNEEIKKISDSLVDRFTYEEAQNIIQGNFSSTRWIGFIVQDENISVFDAATNVLTCYKKKEQAIYNIEYLRRQWTNKIMTTQDNNILVSFRNEILNSFKKLE